MLPLLRSRLRPGRSSCDLNSERAFDDRLPLLANVAKDAVHVGVGLARQWNDSVLLKVSQTFDSLHGFVSGE